MVIVFFAKMRYNKSRKGDGTTARQAVIDFLKEDRGFRVVKLLKQHWKNTHYSYGTTPRPDYGFMLLLHGEVKFLCEDWELVGKAGDVLFLPKNSYYEAVFDGETENYLVNFDGDGELSFSVPLRLLQNAPLSCMERFDLLMEEQIDGSFLRRQGLFYLLLDRIVKETESFGKRKNLEKAKNLLTQELQICEIARACGLSESGLRKEFKEAVGISPSTYRMNYRLAKAKYLLESTDMEVSEIAEALHFYDPAYFCKVFKKSTGMSALQFAKRKQL